MQAEFAPQEQELASTSNSTSSSVDLFISRAAVQSILNSASQSSLKLALQSALDQGSQFILKSAIQRILDSTRQPSPESPPQSPPQSHQAPDTRPIWPGRPELIYKQYLTEKEAWLSAHPSVRPSNYRSARGLDSHSIRYCKEQARFLPIQRLDLESEALIEGRPHWSTEEIQAWLDNKALEQEKVDRQVEAELVAAGGFGQSSERGIQGLWGRIGSDIQARKEQYRFA
jgi:hypothetical protein